MHSGLKNVRNLDQEAEYEAQWAFKFDLGFHASEIFNVRRCSEKIGVFVGKVVEQYWNDWNDFD